MHENERKCIRAGSESEVMRGAGGKRQHHEIYGHTVTKSNGFTRWARRSLVPVMYKYQTGCNPITLKHLVVIGVMKHTTVSINPSVCVCICTHIYICKLLIFSK